MLIWRVVLLAEIVCTFIFTYHLQRRVQQYVPGPRVQTLYRPSSYSLSDHYDSSIHGYLSVPRMS